VIPNGSPYETDKWDTRLNLAVARVVESGLPLVYVNRVGGQDELVFDGGGFVLNADRSMALRQPEFREDIALTTWTRQGEAWICEKRPMTEPYDGLTAVY